MQRDQRRELGKGGGYTLLHFWFRYCGNPESVNTAFLRTSNPDDLAVAIECAGEEAELDEMWSFVGHKGNPRWLWHAIDHHTGAVLAYVFGRRKDEVFLQLKALLEPFGLTSFYTDHWGAYT